MATIEALVFWWRRQSTFWLMALPIAGLAAGVAYALETRREFMDWRQHWAWDFLFTVIYAMVLDRWIKEALLEDALECDETDELRRSTVGPRFLIFAACFGLLGVLGGLCPFPELMVALGASAAALIGLLLPSLAANQPLSLGQAYAVGRPVQVQLFLLVGGAMTISLFAGLGLSLAATGLPDKAWSPAAVAAAQRLIDCLLLAGVGYGLARLFRDLTDWQQPEPADHPLRGLRLATRRA